MGAYIIRRLLFGVVMVFAITLVTFAVFRLIPQVPACLVVPCGPHTTTGDPEIRAANHRIGADRSLPVQYGKFVWKIVRHGSFGGSWTGASIDSVLRKSLPPTISILVGGVVVLILLTIPLAILSALWAQAFLDRAILFFALFGIALHPFVLGFGLRKAFAQHLHLAPDRGYCHFVHVLAPPPPPNIAPQYLPPPPCGGFVAWSHHLILPWLTFALFFLPIYTRMIRTRLLETIDEQHVVTARAKGASELRIIFSHVLRPALLPLVTMMGMDLGAALTAVIYIETIFGFTGLGYVTLQTLANVSGTFDLPMIGAIFFVVATSVVVLNLVVDTIYAWLDPRIRLTKPVTA
jgi:ABC-type dipeptide/oligopeptide/nickel transport system permease component